MQQTEEKQPTAERERLGLHSTCRQVQLLTSSFNRGCQQASPEKEEKTWEVVILRTGA